MGIKFDDISDESLGLKLISVNMGSPEPALIKTEVPGSNGVLDQSEAIAGFVTYLEREFELIYTLMANGEEEYASKISKIKNALHGKKRKIILSSDPNFYYDSRCIVEEAPESSVFAEITVNGTAYPYKYKTSDTVITHNVINDAGIVCNNLSMPIVPTMEVSNVTTPLNIAFKDKMVTFSEGGIYTPDFVFMEGENELQITGNGTIKITYREGSL